MVWQGFLVLGLLFVASILLGYFWLRQRWLIAAGIFWALELLFFTTFLTNGQGVGTGLIGSLGYWIDQQEVMRGGQPWYYFDLLVPLYEFLPLVLFLGGVVAWIASLGRKTRETRKQGDKARTQQGRGERRHGDAGTRRGRSASSHAHSPSDTPAPVLSVQRIFEAFLVFWPLATWAVFT